MAKYMSRFVDAVARTGNAGWLDEDTLVFAQRVMEDQPLGGLTTTIADALAPWRTPPLRWSPGDLAIRCMHAHTGLLMHCITSRIPVAFTIGDVLLDGTPRFGVDDAVLDFEANHPNVEKSLHVHAWLTFPGGDVLDATLKSFLTPKTKRPKRPMSGRATSVVVPASMDGQATVTDFSGADHAVTWVPWLVGVYWLDLANPDAPSHPSRLDAWAHVCRTAWWDPAGVP